MKSRVSMPKQSYGFLIVCMLLIGLKSTMYCAAEVTQLSSQNSQLARNIADCYIKSFLSEGQLTEEVATTKEHTAHTIRPPKLLEKTKREIIFNCIFTKSSKYTVLQQSMLPILNEYAWGDLCLFYGTTSEPAHHLMSRINRTVTTLGESVLATLLVTPTSDVKELSKRQQIIQSFLVNTEGLTRLKKILQRYQEAEESLLSFWTSTDPLYTKEYTKYMNRRFYSKNNPNTNKNAGILEWKKRFFRDFWGIQYNFLWPLTQPTINEIAFSNMMAQPMPILNITFRKFWWKGAIPYYGGWYKWKQTKKINDSKIFATMYFLGEAMYTWTAYKGIKNYLEYASVLRNLALRMADVQTFVKAATEVSACVAASPTLESLYGERLTNIRSFLKRTQTDTELGRLVHYLRTLPYSHWSYFFNNAGKLLASYKLFVEHKDAFADAMYELGELDAFSSIATLIQEAKSYSANHAYVFTKFLDRSKQAKPYIKIEDMWNPFLDAKLAVGNSVVFDARVGGMRNMILTGPNAGGKSTFLTGVTHCLLLSQTFGIAPAKGVVLTPFDKVNTSIDITDDIAAGKSLFMAEVDRAQKHVHMLSQLQRNEFSFSIFDEPFSGTNPTEGAAAEYSVLETIADYTNTINLVATHYPIVMLLEEKCPEKGFVNYKVYITHQGAKRKLHYTYKVVPGKSNQAIAIDILEEQGYDTKLLQRAREIIAHPERYKSTF